VLLTRRARALKRHLPPAVEGDGHGVHQARVASRRLREAVPVLATGLKGSKAGKARRKIRRLTRALGAVRELDVTLSLVDELAARSTLPRTAIEEVRARVMAEVDRRRKVMLDRLEDVNVEKLDRRLQSVAAALQEADSQEWRGVLASRLLERAKALQSAMDAAGRMYAPERLHAVRINAKKLRYTLELAAESGTRAAAASVRLIKRTQDTLGRLHDLQVLQIYVADVQADPPGRTIPSGGLDIVARALEDECRVLHARYVAMIPALSELIVGTRTLIVPQLAASSRRGRPIKMALATRARGQRQRLTARATSRS
jgi:CHAD domain-containing protein